MSQYQQPNFNDIVRYVLGNRELDMREEETEYAREKDESIQDLMDLVKKSKRRFNPMGQGSGGGSSDNPFASNVFGTPKPSPASSPMPSGLKFASDFPSFSSPSDAYKMLGYLSKTYGISPDLLQQGIMQSGRLMKAPPETPAATSPRYEAGSGWENAVEKFMALFKGGGIA